MIEIIDFAIEPSALYSQIEQQIESNEKNIAALKRVENPGFDTVVLPIEKDEDSLSQLWSLASHLQSVHNREENRQRHQEVQQKLAAYSTKLGFDKDLMKIYETIAQQPLEGDEKTVVAHSLENFRLSGVGLDQHNKQKLFKLRQELSALGTTFSEHVLDATDKWHLDVTAEQLQGLNQQQLDYFATIAKKNQRQSDYTVGLDGPSYQIILNYCDNRELRRTLYSAYVVRASRHDQVNKAYDNQEIVSAIISKRQQIAQILGYSNYLECSLAKKFAANPQQVSAFLDDLIAKVRPKAFKELEQLVEFSKSLNSDLEELLPWDVGYYSQKLKKQTLDYNEEELRQYFPCEHVLTQMFKLFGSVYHFEVIQRNDVLTFDPKSSVYELISTQDGRTLGYLFADLFARPQKRGGAWMSDAKSYANYHSWHSTPVAYLVCNFQAAQNPTLTFSDVETLFHEFGHSLHHLLTERELPSIAGINEVPWDIVELPSQLQEQWCYEPQVLKALSSHQETAQSLPDSFIEKIIESRRFQASLHLIRQLEFSKFDWMVHALDECDDPVNFWLQMRQDIAVMPTYENNAFPLGFSHIFAGGYAAGYYSYLWAETYAHQVFDYLKDRQFNTEATQGFKTHFLSIGGDLNLQQKLHDYLNETQSTTPLLKAYGVL